MRSRDDGLDWNEFYNVPMRPGDVIDLQRELIGPDGTLAMPAFPIEQDLSKVFFVDRAPVYTGLLCEVFRPTPGVLPSIHPGSSVCAIGRQAISWWEIITARKRRGGRAVRFAA